MTFCSRERYKKLSIEVHTPMPRLNLYFYGYALDDYCFKLTSPEGEEVDLKHLNQWKEDKNYLEKTDTTLLAKKSQINKLSPFLVELDLINISEGEWELLIEGKVIVDGRIYLMTNLEEKEFTIKHLKKKAFEHTLGNAIIPVDGKDSQMAEDGKAIYYPVLDQMEIEDEKSINVSRVATFMLGLELARNEQLLGFKEAHAYYQKKR